MSTPNYSYCKAWCAGYTHNCPHYKRANPLFKLCYHYKLLSQEAREIINFTEEDINRLEEIARKAGALE